MRGTTMTWIAALALLGCGGETTGEAPEAALSDTSGGESTGPTDAVDTTEETAADEQTTAAERSLPAAPWGDEQLATEQAPGEVVDAWRAADNRTWCAPLAPRSVHGASARRSSYYGGWAVEFDKNGLPGVSANGQACTSCGRGAFGIAGTAVMVDDEDPMEAEERAYSDGSRMRFEPPPFDDGGANEASGHVASLKIQGQDCVYQVWSFVGDEHLESLVHDLRFVSAD